MSAAETARPAAEQFDIWKDGVLQFTLSGCQDEAEALRCARATYPRAQELRVERSSGESA